MLTAILDAAERALANAGADDPATELTLREALRAMFAVVLPMYEDRLGAELGRLTLPCSQHEAPNIGPHCIRCARYTALIGARRLIEGRGAYAGRIRRAALQEYDDGTG